MSELRYSSGHSSAYEIFIQIMNTFHWPVTVYYEDTDAGGVVYHANYLKFFERARTEMLRAVGVHQQSLLEQGIGFVVRHMEIDFLKGAKLDAHLEVVTRVSELKKASLTFCQELVNPDGALLSKAKVKVACIDNESMRPRALPQLISLELNCSDC
ncbi:tol-pal system-associated acyl-CoA thioesterase [Vibrio paracholerae]|uniref:Tol-pal system-associated acyl-CoA thioesterase n=2 Tax=Vibrio paracholerae TaxID=650003 RepID=A0ABX9FF24_9VIBR|nr:tol-pal system-associated acyl-CoA thioesterase [Vibrio paracholerae]